MSSDFANSSSHFSTPSFIQVRFVGDYVLWRNSKGAWANVSLDLQKPTATDVDIKPSIRRAVLSSLKKPIVFRA